VGLLYHILFFFLLCNSLFGRSPFRQKDKNIPQVTAHWHGETKIYRRQDSHYEENPLFTTFHEDHVNSNLLPTEPLSFYYQPSQHIDGHILSNLIEELIVEIKKKRKQYKHFVILQHKNFNRRKKCGLLVLKFKDYPFVVKIFIETPQTFINPYCKGLDNLFFFFMSGGTNRHILGLTRIRNLEVINEYIAKNPRWRNVVKTPRKWFWLPKKIQWIEVKGKNIGNKKQLKTRFPGTYAVVADWINTDHELVIPMHEKKAMIIDLCNNLHMFIDPHANNFIIGYDAQKNHYTISIVDTEHFPSIVGFKKEKEFRNYNEWYLYLAEKCFHDIYLRTKDKRQEEQSAPNHLALPW